MRRGRLAALVLAVLTPFGCSAGEPRVEYRLAVDPAERRYWSGAPPTFTTCEECPTLAWTDTRGRKRELRVRPEPILVIEPEDVEAARIRETAHWDAPEVRFYALEFVTDDETRSALAAFRAANRSNRFAILVDGELVGSDVVAGALRDTARAGYFHSRARAEDVVARLGVESEFVPFDPDAFEAQGAEMAESAIDSVEYLATHPEALERLLEEQPDFLRDLEDASPELYERFHELRSGSAPTPSVPSVAGAEQGEGRPGTR